MKFKNQLCEQRKIVRKFFKRWEVLWDSRFTVTKKKKHQSKLFVEWVIHKVFFLQATS